MSVQICCINGVGGSGKDTFVEACKKLAIADVYNLSMIDYVKTVAKQLGWDGKKDDEGRRFLSDLKDALENYNDRPYAAMVQSIWDIVYNNDAAHDYLGEDKSCLIFVHARDPKDIQRLVKDFNAFTVLIRRPVVEDNHTFTNHADLDVLKYHPYDFIYWNIGNINRIDRDADSFMEIIDKFGKKYGVEDES